MSQNLTGAEEKALRLLGSNIPNHAVAQATGLSDSRISQLLSEDWFKSRVNELRYTALIKHNELDDRFDSLESKLTEKLERTVDLMFRPQEIVRTLQTVNSLKRRGVSSPEATNVQQPTLSLVMPTVILQQFTKSGNNQVVQVDSTPLITIQPEQLLRMNGNGHETRVLPTPENGVRGAEQISSPSSARLREKLNAIRARQAESREFALENPT